MGNSKKKYMGLLIKQLSKKILLLWALMLFFLFSISFTAKCCLPKSSLLTVGIFMDDDDDVSQGIVSMLQGIESIRVLCDIQTETVTQQDEEMIYRIAGDRIRDGVYRVVLIIPADFMKNAIAMEKAEFTLLVSSDMTNGERKVLTLVETVRQLIHVTETAINTVWYDIDNSRVAFHECGMEDEIMLRFIACFMERNRLFDVNSISAYGSFTFLQYYRMSLIIIICLITAGVFLSSYNVQYRTIEKMMLCSQKNILAIYKLLLMTGLLLPEMLFLSVDMLSFVAIAAFLVTSFSIVCFVNLVGTLLYNNDKKVLFYGLVSFMMLIISGIIFPDCYLPTFLRNVVDVWPIRNWHVLMLTGVYGGSLQLPRTMGVILTDLAMLVWSYLCTENMRFCK